jgi:hypothetical protein
MKIETLIPFQYTGKESNTTHSVEANNNHEAQNIFLAGRKNLLNVNNWHKLAGAASATFQLVDKTGNEVNRNVQVGDYFKINIPGPGTKNGQGYDWVRVEEVEEQIKHNFHVWVAIKVRPASSPTDSQQHTAHFFSNEATSSFVVERRGLIVTASVYGKNEKPNTYSDGLLTTLRNTLIAVIAMLGLNKPQWRSLVKGILEERNQ